MAIIKQKVPAAASPNLNHPATVPNFRQLGTVLRITAAVIACGFIYALSRFDGSVPWFNLFSGIAAQLAPPLLLTLCGLLLGANALQKLPYFFAAGLVVGWGMVAVALTKIYLLDGHGAAVLRDIALAALMGTTMLAYFRLRMQALSPALAEARLQALQARIRPHFLFNSLNAVLSLIRSEPQRAERLLENLSDLFRVLMADNRNLVPLQDEVELARQYMEIEQVRIGERLVVEWHIDKMPQDARVPPLILQPLLENAVYHGIEQVITPGQVVVNIYRRGDEVFIMIRNPYHGKGNHHAGNKMALGNIRERLRLHFDVEAELKSSIGPDYYQVIIRVPYQPS